MKLTIDELKKIIKEELDSLKEYNYEDLTSDEKRAMEKARDDEIAAAWKKKHAKEPRRGNRWIGPASGREWGLNVCDPNVHPQGNFSPEVQRQWDQDKLKCKLDREREQLAKDAAADEKAGAKMRADREASNIKYITPMALKMLQAAGVTPQVAMELGKQENPTKAGETSAEEMLNLMAQGTARAIAKASQIAQQQKLPHYALHLKTFRPLHKGGEYTDAQISREDALEFLNSVAETANLRHMKQAVQYLRALPQAPPEKKRSFLQKLGSLFTTGKFKESKLRLSKSELNQIIKEELQAVTKGN